MRILFMGTPDFALFSLKALVESGEDVIGVVTQPDKPRGRGYALMPPPVKVYAMEQSILVYQPATLKGEEFAALLSELDPELIVVVAFGKILPKNVLDYPKYGCINVHGSLLPAYRGAAPMQRAIIDGCTVTGITTMYMDVGLDTGDMLLKDEVEIGENDNFEDMHDRLGAVGAGTLLRTIAALKSGTLKLDGNHSLEIEVGIYCLAAELLDKFSVGCSVANSGVTSYRLGDERATQRIIVTQHLALDATMLVAECNLEVEHLLAITYKAEGTWLDNACVDRTHVHFV